MNAVPVVIAHRAIVGASNNPQERYRLTEWTRRHHTGEQNSLTMNYRMRNITTTYIKIHSLMCAINHKM